MTGNSKDSTQDSTLHDPQNQADEQMNGMVTAYPLDSTMKDSPTLACSSFSGHLLQSLPTEIRQMIYDEAVSSPWYETKYRKLVTRDHYIYYEDTSQALALLRNGSFWESDACNAPEVKLAIQPFTLHAYWETLGTLSGPKQGFLVGLLKGLDAVFAMDQEYQRASSTRPRKWTAPLSPTVLKYGYLILRLYLALDFGKNLWTFKNEDRENEQDQTQSPGAFLQTAILHLRRNSVINIRIFVHYSLSATRGTRDARIIEQHIRTLLTPLSYGMTKTRLPRCSTTDLIRHSITLVTYDEQFSYWKERLKCFEGQVQWEKATRDEDHGGPVEAYIRDLRGY